MVEQDDSTRRGSPRAIPARSTKHALLMMALGAAILLSGIAIGVGAFMSIGPDRSKRGGRPPNLAADAMATRIARQCGLDEMQTEQVRQILTLRLEAMRKVREEMSGRMDKEIQGLRDDMANALTGEQFRKWDRRFQSVRRRARGDGPEHGYGRGTRRGKGRDGMAPRPGRPQSRPSRRGPFARLDANGDGQITRDEVPEKTWDELRPADTDGDGKITRDEARQHRARSKPTPPPELH